MDTLTDIDARFNTRVEHRENRDGYARLVARELLKYVRSGRDLNNRGPFDMLGAFLDEFERAEAAVQADKADSHDRS